MSAVPQPDRLQFEPLAERWLDAVVAIETRAYDHPWTRGNFADSVRAGYEARVLLAGDELLGYFVAMKGVDEVHLLNITVAPEHQSQGLGRYMLETVSLWARTQAAQWLWLEVRVSNQRAQRIYERHGLRRVGERKGYYPASGGQREDAIVMSLRL